MQSILKKSTTSILLIFAISVCVFLDSDESLLLVPPKSELFTAVNYKIRSVAALSATSYLEQAKEVQLRNRHSPLFSTTTSGEDSGKKEGTKKPSLFKSLRIRSPVSSHNDDAATVQSKMDEKLTDQPKPARSKKQIPIAREISQDEDVSSNSKKAITPISKVAEENIVISELENITPKSKPTKRVKKQNNDNLENLESIISISSATPATTTTTTTTTAATGGDNELEFFLEEGSKYIAEHSVIMTPSELHKISSKNSGIKSNSAAGGKNRGKIELDETKMKEIQDLIERRFDHKYHREFDEADKIREQLLEEYDVEIFDRNGVWQTRDKSISRPLKGFTASYADKVQPAKPIKCSLNTAEIQKLVEQRTKHRRARKFDLADQIRDLLADSGVEVMDKSNEWRSFDGTLGGLQSEDFGVYR